MKAVLDACVIFPPVLRDLLLGVAVRGLYQPVWSERILREWVRATAKLGAGAMAGAEVQATLLRVGFPAAMTREQPGIEARLSLPDPNDVHVLAVAIASHADCIVTFNAADFPRHLLAEEGLERRDPDGFLWQLWSHHPAKVNAAVTDVHARAEAMAGAPVSLNALLKRAKLGRLARAVLSDARTGPR